MAAAVYGRAEVAQVVEPEVARTAPSAGCELDDARRRAAGAGCGGRSRL